MDDWQLLNDYATRNSEEAFRALVERYAGMVFHTALRQLGNPHSAEEVAQAVFIILAQKAATIHRQPTLYGWLFRATRFAVLNQQRQERNRVRREQKAYVMQSASNSDDPNPVWEQITPHLDDALEKLPATDRELVMIRYFGNKSHREAARMLGVSEEVVRKRLSRAMEKLRVIFVRRGVAVSSLVLVAAFTAHGVQAAPLGLASSLTGVAVAKGAAVSSSTLTLIKGALKIMAWTKAKTAVVAVTAVILATGTTTVIVKRMATGPTQVDGTSIDDSFFEANGNTLMSAPPNLLILRPTHSTQVSGPLWISGHKGMAPDTARLSGRCVSLESVFEEAYNFPASKMIFPPDVPNGKFDFLVTVSGNVREKFQVEITKQLGMTGRRVTRDTEVFLLKLKTLDAPGLRRATGGSSTSGYYVGGNNNGKYVAENAPISMLAGQLERSLKQIVLDKTGLTGKYNIELEGRVLKSLDTLKEPLLDQLGLELVPTNMPVEMLAVEKAK